MNTMSHPFSSLSRTLHSPDHSATFASSALKKQFVPYLCALLQRKPVQVQSVVFLCPEKKSKNVWSGALERDCYAGLFLSCKKRHKKRGNSFYLRRLGIGETVWTCVAARKDWEWIPSLGSNQDFFNI
ncbi:hypothetical protein JTE90_024537 [Oedothorax gibbosus]|uniref:Uncharacterized protein n=1 Tax=Oedothorax gibbosus TaxID=931172 RepID=A0AAV6VBS0_9ARAC|nr:hypothetical protein JTE90_024537 [Oedothorax gibbosus]